MGAPPNQVPSQTRTEADLLSSLVVILISVGVTIFVFWASSQFLSRDTFSKLPSFLTDSYKAIWSSVVTGAAGIGLAILKAIASKGQPQPNYLKLIGVTTAGLVVIVIGLVIFAEHSNSSGHVVLQIPPNVVRIDVNNHEVKNFDLVSDPLQPVIYLSYAVHGNFSIVGRTIKGHLTSGRIVMSQQTPHDFPTSIAQLSINIHYYYRVNGNDVMNVYPVIPKPPDSSDLGVAIEAGKTYAIPPFDFEFEIPDNLPLDRAWLASHLVTSSRGYFPAQ